MRYPRFSVIDRKSPKVSPKVVETIFINQNTRVISATLFSFLDEVVIKSYLTFTSKLVAISYPKYLCLIIIRAGVVEIISINGLLDYHRI